MDVRVIYDDMGCLYGIPFRYSRQINAKGIAEPIDIQEVSRVWSERMAKANLRRAERAERRNMAVTRAVGEPNSTLTGSKKGLVILMEGINTLCLHTQFTQGPIGLCAAAVGYQYHNLSVFTITWRRYEKINETPRRNLKK